MKKLFGHGGKTAQKSYVGSECDWDSEEESAYGEESEEYIEEDLEEELEGDFEEEFTEEGEYVDEYYEGGEELQEECFEGEEYEEYAEYAEFEEDEDGGAFSYVEENAIGESEKNDGDVEEYYEERENFPQDWGFDEEIQEEGEYSEGEYIGEEACGEGYFEGAGEGVYAEEAYSEEEDCCQEYCEWEDTEENYIEEGYDAQRSAESGHSGGEVYEEDCECEESEDEYDTATYARTIGESKKNQEWVREEYVQEVCWEENDSDIPEDEYGEENIPEYCERDTSDQWEEEEPEYDSEEIYVRDEAYDEDQAYIDRSEKKRAPRHMDKKASQGMELMDKVMLAAGVGILILVIASVGIFLKKRMPQSQVARFAGVGLQLEGINLIGESGMEAVADAWKDRMEAAAVTPKPSEPNKDYDEIDYSRQVVVAPDFTSIQKDLKIKFINEKSEKLVPNVPFSVTVQSPDGKTYIWSDDDMDGIIYKKDIAPGAYLVAMETLTDSRYSEYTITDATHSVEVKREIVYEKVDVANEVKQETEVNAAKEDTKKNETVVESSLQDTVVWVESKVISSTYNEVAKSTIPDPVTLVRRQDGLITEPVVLVAQTITEAPLPTEVPTPVPTEEPIPIPSEEPTPMPTEVPTPVPTEMATPIPTVEPTPMPTEVPTPVPTEGPAVTAVPAKGTIVLNQTTLAGSTGGTMKVKAAVAGFAESRKIVYSAWSENPAVAAVSVDAEGNVEVQGVAVGTTVINVTANYENGTSETEASAKINVTIGGIMSMTLDVDSVATFVQTPVTIHANLINILSQNPVVTAESSDNNIATVSVDNKAVTVTGVAQGSAVVTVKYAENGTEVSASCEVTVKANPKQDRNTLLKDADGRQLYVAAGNTYREAVYADYYEADKFFVKGDIKYTGWQTIEGKVYYYTADGNKVTGEQIIQGAKYNFASDGSLVTGDGTLGIDVSKWNGVIDWNAVKNSGISYVIIRSGYRGSSEGKLIEDPKFEENIKGATEAGLKVGVYFFTQAINEIEAVEEASMVLEQLKGYKISYPVFLDVEASGGRGDKIDKATRTAVCKAFCQTIQGAGYTAGVYSGKLWLEGQIDAGSLSSYKIWVAQYAAVPTYTGRYDMWQYKANGSISGISGNVDMNISYLGY